MARRYRSTRRTPRRSYTKRRTVSRRRSARRSVSGGRNTLRIVIDTQQNPMRNFPIGQKPDSPPKGPRF